MDLATPAQAIFHAILPALPFFTKAGQEVVSKVALDSYAAGKKLLGKLWQKAETQPTLSQALHDLTVEPENVDNQTILQLQLKKLLAADPAFAAELQTLLPATHIQQNSVTAQGSHIIAIGGINTGSNTIGVQK
jgi:hypothetical protein